MKDWVICQFGKIQNVEGCQVWHGRGCFQPWCVVVEKKFLVRKVGSLYLVKKVGLRLLVMEE
jgi:hypothetical protein